MRIGYVHSTDFPTVDANVVQVVQMCRGFASFGHEVTLFIPRAATYASDKDALAEAHQLFGGELPFKIEFVPRVRLFGRLEMLGTVKGTLAAIRRTPLDLVYTRNPWTVAFLPRAGVPYVFEAHEERVHVRSALLNRLLRGIIVRNSRKPSCVLIVAISRALADIWHGFGVPREKLTHAHDAVELSLFDIGLSKDAARSELSAIHPSSFILHPSRPLVVYTGALKTDRGIDLMLSAAQALPELDFYFVGGKEDEIAFWRGEVTRLNLANAFFPGRVPHREIPLWLAAADILLMMWTWQVPTIRGCSPMKMFEYMAARRLIVGPAFPTVCEVLEDGRDALLFEPDNQAALIDALRTAVPRVNDPTLPAAAYAKVARDYTWTARCRHILSELEKRRTKNEER